MDTTAPQNVRSYLANISDDTITLGLQGHDFSDIKQYNIYRDDYSTIYATTKDNYYIDKNIVPGTAYHYKIKAVDNLGNISDYSSELQVQAIKKSTSTNGNSLKPNGTPVYIRVVGYEDVIIPKQLIYVENGDLDPYLGTADGSSATTSKGWSKERFKSGPTHAHAIVKVLQSKNINYDLQDYGWSLYMAMIDGEREKDILSTSGWMYDVNGSRPNVGSNANVLNDYDEVTWYFSAYGDENLFPSIKVNKKKIDLDEPVEITLKNIYAKNKKDIPIQNAVIFINGEKTSYRTDKNGKVSIFFDADGYYNISATHQKNGIYDMVISEKVEITAGNPKSSRVGDSSTHTKKDLKQPINTQYTAEYTILRKESTTETDAMAAINNLRDKIYGASLKVDTAERASKLVSDAQDASELIRWSLDKIETPQAAEETIGYANDLMSALVTSTEILKDTQLDAEKQSKATDNALKATKANVDNVLNTMNTILSRNDEIDKSKELIENFASKIVEIKENISPESREQLNALITTSAQESLDRQTKIVVETRDDGYVALFNGISLVDVESIHKRSTDLTQTLLEMTDTEVFKPVVPTLVLDVDTKSSDQVTAYIEKAALKSVGLSDDASVLVKTPIGSVQIPDELRTSATGNQIKVSLTRIPSEAQGENLKSFIKNDSQVIDIKVSMNKVDKTLFDEPIEISIPYDAGESTQHKLVVYHERTDGTFEKIAGVYDPESQMVTFKTKHLSQYFVKPATPKFDDVNDTQWAKKSIERLNALEVIKGKDEFNFMPEEKVTRAEFATMLNRLMTFVPDSKKDLVVKRSFNDVANGQWYSNAVNKVAAKSWMNGKSNDRFDPNGYITEQEIACVIGKVLIEHGYKLPTNTVQSKEVARWAQPSVTLINQLGIMDSLSVRGFKPTEQAQRDEVAVLLDELSKVLIKN